MKVTEEHLEYFSQCCDEFIELFGLKDWNIHCSMADTCNIAETVRNVRGHIASVFLCKEWDDTVVALDRPRLRSSALHEICHVVLARMSYYGKDRFPAQDAQDEAEEAAIRRIVNAFLGKKSTGDSVE